MKAPGSQSANKPPVDREGVRVLAIAIGAREAARQLGLNENTVLGWAKRYKWNLPKRNSGPLKQAQSITAQSTPGDALIAKHKELEGATKTALMQTLAKAAKEGLAKKDALPVETIAQFKDACLAGAKLFGWDGKPQATVNINNQVGVGIVCTEEQRQRLIAQLDRLKDRPAMTTLPAQPAQLQAGVGAGKGIVEAKPGAVDKHDEAGPAVNDNPPSTLPHASAGAPAFWLEHRRPDSEQAEDNYGNSAGW